MTKPAKTEAELAEMDDEDRAMFLAEMGQDEPGLNRLIRAAYKLLGLQTYFTAGVKEVRAWTIHVGDTGPQAAGVIHTDFEKGFIRAETIAYEDYVALGGEARAREAGKLRAPVDRSLPLAQFADALRRVEGREVIGKIVLLPE